MKLFSRLEIAVYRWLKQRRDQRIMRGQASLVATSATSEYSRIWAGALLAGLAARKDICAHCMRPYDYWEQTQGQKFQLRAILGVHDREPDPKLCKSCHDTAIATYNPRYTMPGTSNMGPPNLVLIDKYTHASKNHG